MIGISYMKWSHNKRLTNISNNINIKWRKKNYNNTKCGEDIIIIIIRNDRKRKRKEKWDSFCIVIKFKHSLKCARQHNSHLAAFSYGYILKVN